MGKEIVRFHSIIWPIMLMAMEEEIPKKVYGHGWLVVDGTKMSKSIGNVVDPNGLIDEFGADAIRYFLLREINLGSDGNFSRDALINRINADLANDLGNLLYRTVSMVEKYHDGELKNCPAVALDVDTDLVKLTEATLVSYQEHMDKLEINDAIKAVWSLVASANKYIDDTAHGALEVGQRTGRCRPSASGAVQPGGSTSLCSCDDRAFHSGNYAGNLKTAGTGMQRTEPAGRFNVGRYCRRHQSSEGRTAVSAY